MAVYLTNKELMLEIHRSKNSFCSFKKPEYADYDIIVNSLDEVTDELLAPLLAKKKAAAPTHSPCGTSYKSRPVSDNGLIIRVMTDEHIPLDPESKSRSKMTGEGKAEVNFPPFLHYRISRNSIATPGERKFTEVGRSHWIGRFAHQKAVGKFSTTHGKITNKLALQWMKLAEKYGRDYKWRHYSYNDEMQAMAIAHLCQIGLQFNEAKSNNPFAYFTSSIRNVFLRQLGVEKKQQQIRDDLIIASGLPPSSTKQMEDDLAKWEPVALKGRVGRPKKARA